MFLDRIEVFYKNSAIQLIVGQPMDNITENVNIKPDPDKIIKTIQLTENLLKVEYGTDDVTWLPLNNFSCINYKS